jgi:hypothetical protein
MTLASLLYGTLRFPAIVLVCDDLVDSARRAIAETVPHASIQVIDWCHPAPAEPADITLLGESQLPRTAGTIAGYDAATIAIFTGIRATPQARYHQAIRWLLHAANDPLIVLEEWTHPDIIAAAVARLAGIAEHDAQVRVNRWLDQTFDPAATARPPYPSTSALLAARDLCARPQRAAA